MRETTGGGDVDNRKWWAKAIMVGGVVAAVCLPLGALGAKVGIWGFQGGFMLLAVGTVLATIAFFLGIVAYVVCINKKLVPERKSILIGVGISAVILATSAADAGWSFSPSSAAAASPAATSR